MEMIDNIFMFKNGDILQICENGHWTDLGVIKDSKSLAADMYKSNMLIMNKPARVIRRS